VDKRDNKKGNKMTKKELVETLQGLEIWTCINDDRRCVGVEGDYVIDEGKKIAKLTKKLARQLFNDYCEQSGINTEAGMLREEFGF